MGFDVNKFKREYKRIHDENKELRERLTSFEPQKAADIKAAVQMATKPLYDQMTNQKTVVTGHEQNLRNKDIDIARLEAELRQRGAELDAAKQLSLHMEVDRDQWKAKHDEQLPTVLLAEKKARDLEALLNKHQDRMNRKEKEAESAILNRKAIAGVAPAVNRR